MCLAWFTVFFFLALVLYLCVVYACLHRVSLSLSVLRNLPRSPEVERGKKVHKCFWLAREGKGEGKPQPQGRESEGSYSGYLTRN